LAIIVKGVFCIQIVNFLQNETIFVFKFAKNVS